MQFSYLYTFCIRSLVLRAPESPAILNVLVLFTLTFSAANIYPTFLFHLSISFGHLT